MNNQQSRDIGELVMMLQDGGEHTKHELNTLMSLIKNNEDLESRMKMINKLWDIDKVHLISGKYNETK